jgi:prefoldin subunit 5
MEDLLKFLKERVEALEKRNQYVENELTKAKEILQTIVNELEVIEPTNSNDEEL